MKLPWFLSALVMLSTVVISVTKADCDNPPDIPNTTNNITGTLPYPQDTTVRYDCVDGYNPAGTSRFYTCTGTTWTGGNFRCEEIFCSHVETPENGRILNSPDNKVGTEIQFACNEGHTMSGERTMICFINGDWSPSSPPTCTAKDCGEFGPIQYADIFQDNSLTERNHYGSVVQVTCNEEMTLIGPSSVECQSDGQWGTRPTCEVLQCPPYPNTNSPCVSSSEYFGNYLYIFCNNNISTHFGPDAAECISGEWDTTDMGCLCDCILPEFNSTFIKLTNLNNYDNLEHATALEWECITGTSKHPLVNVLCIDGQLRAEENNNVILIANYTNPINMNEIIHALCNLPSTDTSTKMPTVPDEELNNTTVKKSNAKLDSGALSQGYTYCIYYCFLQILFLNLMR